MEADTRDQVAFFLTGRRQAPLEPAEGRGLRPVLFAGYRDVSQLRHDFPMVLVAGRADEQFAQSLSGIVDAALLAAARGPDAERIRKHVLMLEQEIRTLLDSGVRGKLSALWDAAAKRLGAADDKTFADSLKRVRKEIKLDGELAVCDAALPATLLRHAWNAVQKQKAQRFRASLDRLELKLADILTAADQQVAGSSPERLRAAVGSIHDSAFDFDALSRVLTKALPKAVFPASRRARIEGLLQTLRGQRFFPAAKPAKDAPAAYTFQFDSCAEALTAFRERSPRLVELAKAIAIAELEIDGQYSESRHDSLFEHFGANGIDPDDLAPFPDYLVCLNAAKMTAAEHAQLVEILTSGLQIKVLLQIDDILEEAADGQGMTAGMRSRQLANMAIGLNEAYVLQSSASNLFRFRERVLRGITYHGPALFGVFSGASGTASGLSPYLTAAAAMESRAFPAFAYDPSAGPNWALRFHLEINPQVDLDWPVHGFTYADERLQRVSSDVAFTAVDFFATDRRYARHLAIVPKDQWHDGLIPVDEALAKERRGLPTKLPSLWMVDATDVLHRVLVDERLIREARRCREMWHSLQELGGVNNSHAEKLLAREKRAWEERMQKAADAQPAAVAAAVAAAAAPAAAAPVAVAEPEQNPDEPYIETPRCSTCNECTLVNPKMFAYNENKQAFIKDVKAGTYAQLVQAAENCQVAIIHPGKPKNPNEPGLEELVKRAEALFA